MSEELNIIYEDKNILVCYKRAGLAVQTSKITETDLEHQVLNYCSKNTKNPFIGLIHRLDQPVEGLVLFAKDKKTAGILSNTINAESTGKNYLALVEGKADMISGEWANLTDYLLKDGRTNCSKVVAKNTPGAKHASLDYRVLKSGKYKDTDISLLEIKLHTGRHHQIRVQLSNAGIPLVGDRKYNPEGLDAGSRFPALFAYYLSFVHPASGKLVELECKPQGDLFRLI